MTRQGSHPLQGLRNPAGTGERRAEASKRIQAEHA
jgi:hypothetical protein